MASETVDPIYWSHPQPSWAVPPEPLVHSINRCSSATTGIRSCNLATFSMRGNHLPIRPLRVCPSHAASDSILANANFMCQLHMPVRYVNYKYQLHMSITYVNYICQLHMPITYGNYICQLHMPITYANYICQLHMPITYANYICQLHMPITYANYICKLANSIQLPTTYSQFVRKKLFGKWQTPLSGCTFSLQTSTEMLGYDVSSRIPFSLQTSTEMLGYDVSSGIPFSLHTSTEMLGYDVSSGLPFSLHTSAEMLGYEVLSNTIDVHKQRYD